MEVFQILMLKYGIQCFITVMVSFTQQLGNYKTLLKVNPETGDTNRVNIPDGLLNESRSNRKWGILFNI